MSKPLVRLAVVDDDASVCRALARLLRVRGFAVSTYLSAREFLGSLPHATPECLIVDLQMPEMTGLELQQHLRRAGFDIPVILITAHDEAAANEEGRAGGAVAYLVKPLQQAALIDAIRTATDRLA